LQTALPANTSYLEPGKTIATSSEQGQTGFDISVSSFAAQSLGALLPEIHTQVLNLYRRSLFSISVEPAPQICFSDHVLRLARLLTDVHKTGSLDELVLRSHVLGEPLRCENSTQNAYPPRGEIARWAMKAVSPFFDNEGVLPVSYRIKVIATLAQIMGGIGFRRKRAMLLHKLLQIMVPKLVQARLVGASEWGMHPSAALGLVPQTGDSDVTALMRSVITVYGAIAASDNRTEPGWLTLKAEVIRQSITVCEALPHPAGVIHFTSLLLSISGLSVDKEEEIRLAGNLPRFTSTGKKDGLLFEADYWDPFVLQDINLGR